MAGIDRIRFYVPPCYLDLKILAATRRVDPAKYCIGLGQDRMAICPPDEDVVTMAANAAAACLDGMDPSRVDLLIFATESGIDQSKAAAIYVHELLGLSPSCMALEIKQACCGSTIAMQLALDRVRCRPESQVLVVASDIARYGLDTPGEPTQGAAAAAFLVTAEPRLLEVEPVFGNFTEETMDFWRPPYRDEACVDGKYSIRMYLKALLGAWEDYRRRGGRPVRQFRRFCYHQPFTKMAHKAHQRLLTATDSSTDAARAEVEPGLFYNRHIGNSYTASLYISIASMLELESLDLTGERLACFAYGSGCTAIWFDARVQPGYREVLAPDQHRQLLRNRRELRYAEYEAIYTHPLPRDGSVVQLPAETTGRFRLTGLRNHMRQYARCKHTENNQISGVA